MSSYCVTDDVLVFTKSPKVEDHIADLEKVLKRFEKIWHSSEGNKAQTRIAIHAVLGVIMTGMIPNPERQQRSKSWSILKR